MKSCVQRNLVYGWEDFPASRDRTLSARSVGQRLTHWATRVPTTHPEDADGMANSEGPDQTAPLGSAQFALTYMS